MTNSEPKAKPSQKRTLEYDDCEEQLENTPLSKRASPHPALNTTTQASVIDDEELDFL